MRTSLPAGGKRCPGCSLCFWGADSVADCPFRDKAVSIVLYLTLDEFLKVHGEKESLLMLRTGCSVWEVTTQRLTTLSPCQMGAALRLAWDTSHCSEAAWRRRPCLPRCKLCLQATKGGGVLQGRAGTVPSIGVGARLQLPHLGLTAGAPLPGSPRKTPGPLFLRMRRTILPRAPQCMNLRMRRVSKEVRCSRRMCDSGLPR